MELGKFRYSELFIEYLNVKFQFSTLISVHLVFIYHTELNVLCTSVIIPLILESCVHSLFHAPLTW